MRLLLDTHALLWWLADDPRLAPEGRKAIACPDHLVYVSAVSVWEIIIEQSLGKLELPADFAEVLAAEPFEPLPITADHALRVAHLPPLHSDPIDRMLVAQALCEGLTIVTRDAGLARYGVPLVPA